MATFLFAWELGGGLGHLLPFRPIAQAMIANRHQVVASLRDQKHATRAYGDLPIRCLPSPHKFWRTDDRIEPLLTFAHILHNTGWSRSEDLGQLVSAWHTLLCEVRPDVVICDHSPTMLLAMRGRGIKHATFGTGFCIPPDETPLPIISPWFKANPEKLQRDEGHVLQIANDVLASNGQPPLDHLTQLYGEANEQILTTFAELDHYPGRKNGEYSGVWPSSAGQPFKWPSGEGSKTYAYFKNFPALLEVARFLQERRLPTVIFAPGLTDKLQAFASASLQVTDVPLDLQQVGREADLAIHHGTHGLTAELLLAGKPAVMIPLMMEQAILAGRIATMGAGIYARNDRPDEIRVAIARILETDKHTNAAQRFAQNYADFAPDKALAAVVERLGRLTE